MLYKDLLVAYDGSEPSQEALVVAKDMVGDMPDASICILAVIPLGAVGVGVESPIEPIGSGYSPTWRRTRPCWRTRKRAP